jgi:4'-phosphopantetheinyl transferase
MGRLARQAGEAGLTGPRWHDGPLGALSGAEGPVVWSVRLDRDAAAEALKRAPHSDRDLADFAAAPDAANRLIRRRLTRALLGEIAGVPPAAILFGRTAAGAPSVLAPEGWHVSVAGRAPLALVGLARAPLGVDVEPLDTAPPLWDMLSPDEAEQVRALPTARQPQEWLRRWTAKEAHAKRLGYARQADPAAIETAAHGPHRLLARSHEGVSLCWRRIVSGRVEAAALAAL